MTLSTRRFAFTLALAVLSGSPHPATLPAAETAAASRLQITDVITAVRSNLVGVTETELQSLAIEGFLTALRPRVLLVTEEILQERTNTARIADSGVDERAYGYVRVGQVEAGLARDLQATVTGLAASNTLKGLILDLRFASGQDYAEAGTTADLFVSTERTLFTWAGHPAASRAKTNSFSLPLVTLVNPATSGAAECLAAVLRDIDATLLIGGTTAGHAGVLSEVALANGLRLLIRTGDVKLASGHVLSTQGVKPDIEVRLTEAEERAYLEHPTRAIGATSATSTSATAPAAHTPRRRPNEADLVRWQREGLDRQTGAATPPPPRAGSEKSQPIMRDPVRARALDVLKALALLRGNER
jgi:C-terminal processing protease CtpA/Prc